MLCSTTYKTGMGTSNLTRHLKRRHPEAFARTGGKQQASPNITQYLESSKYPPDSNQRKKLDHLVTVMIAKDMRPVSVVEGKGFKALVEGLNNKYTLPSRRALTSTHLPKLLEEEKDKLRTALGQVPWCSLTSDMWTSRTNSAFFNVTVHYLKGYTLDTKVLCCLQFPESHTGANMAVKLSEQLEEYGIKDKIVAITTDNAANAKSFGQRAGLAQVFCYAHCLNLCAQDVLKEEEDLKEVRQKISSLVKAVRRSPGLKVELENCQKRLNLPPKVLIAEVKTRWNSAFLMLERAYELKDAITLFQNHASLIEHALTPGDWSTAKVAIEILQPLFEATKEMSGEQYITSSKVIPMTKNLLEWYNRDATQREDQNSRGSQLSRLIFLRLEERFEQVKNNNNICNT